MHLERSIQQPIREFVDMDTGGEGLTPDSSGVGNAGDRRPPKIPYWP